MSSLYLSIQKFFREIFKLPLATFHSELLEKREAWNVPQLTLVLLVVQLQVVEVLFQSVANHHFVIQDFFKLKDDKKRYALFAYNWCDFRVTWCVFQIFWLDPCNPLSVVSDLRPGLNECVEDNISIKVNNTDPCKPVTFLSQDAFAIQRHDFRLSKIYHTDF